MDLTPKRVQERYLTLPRLADTLDFGRLEQVVVLDTETTGLSFTGDELTQIAAARMWDGQVVDWFVTFVDPGKPIPEEISHLTNIYDADVAGAPDPDEARRQLAEFVGDLPIVAHNAGFDRNFCTKSASGAALADNLWIDSLDLTRIALPRLKGHRLLDLVHTFDAPLSTHRADDDVRALCAIYRILLAAVHEMPLDVLAAVCALDSVENWPSVAVFRDIYQMRLREGGVGLVPRPERGAVAAAGPLAGKAADGEAGAATAATGDLFAAASAGDSGNPDPTDLGNPDPTDPATPETAFAHYPGPSEADWEDEDFRRRMRDAFSLKTMRRRSFPANTAAVATKLRTAEAAEAADGLTFPSPEDIEDAFSPEGLLGRIYPGFEQRDQQLAMAEAVRSAFQNESFLEVEAGTGVGKSMAYLVPASLTALRNRIGIGVATRTNALLDQLVNKELPALAGALSDAGEGELSYVPLKGFDHYLCLNRLEQLLRRGGEMRDTGGTLAPTAPSIASALSYAEQSEYDDCDGLKLDNRVLPRRRMCISSRECSRKTCPFFRELCFPLGARKKAESAHIVVTNHAMLFCDAAADGALLPPIEYWVVDEAHGMEEQARSSLSYKASSERISFLGRALDPETARKLYERAAYVLGMCEGGSSDPAADPAVTAGPASASSIPTASGSEAGTTPAISVATPAPGSFAPGTATPISGDGSTDVLGYAQLAKLRHEALGFSQTADAYVERVKDLLYFDASRSSKGYDRVELWVNDDIRASEHFAGLKAAAEALLEQTNRIVKAGGAFAQSLEAVADEAAGLHGAAPVPGLARRCRSLANELVGHLLQLQEEADALTAFFDSDAGRFAYGATISKQKGSYRDVLESLMIDVGPELKDRFYDRMRSVVFSSATMSIADSFDNFERSVGIPLDENHEHDTLALDSCYDFDANMDIFVVTDMPEPNDPRYLGALQDLLRDIHLTNGGGVLSLFTNRREMEACYREVNPALKEADQRLICQRWGVSVKNLRDEFVLNRDISLFALKSFWEGFDAPGDTLRCVVIPKLPFARPGDPLSCERAARDRGAWTRYVLPRSIIETKQAAGRLIRSKDDHGALIFADSRLVTKNYGAAFLRSMPSNNIHHVTTAELARLLLVRADERRDARLAADPLDIPF